MKTIAKALADRTAMTIAAKVAKCAARIALMTCAIVFTSTLLTGCTTPQEIAAPDPKLATMNAKVEGEMVQGYPTAIPLWEGAKVTASDQTALESSTMYDLTMTTSDKLKDVFAGYVAAFNIAGFTVEQDDESETSLSITAHNDFYQAFYTFTTTEDGKTEIMASIDIRN